MRPATFAQQAVYDAYMDVANTLKSGREPSAEELDHVRDALALLKLEPQSPGFVEALVGFLQVLQRKAQ